MQARPELIVVEGHEAGLRAVLMDNMVSVGRSRQCQIQLMEPYIPRRQAEFRQTSEGWLIENGAGRPIRINGKKYSEGERVYLDTGDIVWFGLQTKLLFVAGPDDPDVAMGNYRAKHPDPEPVEPMPIPPLLAEKYNQTGLMMDSSSSGGGAGVALLSGGLSGAAPASDGRGLFASAGSSAPAPAQTPAVAPAAALASMSAPVLAGSSTPEGAVAIPDDLIPMDATASSAPAATPAPVAMGGMGLGEEIPVAEGAPLSPETDILTEEDIARRKKYKLYAIIGGAWVVVLIGIIVLLTMLKNNDDGDVTDLKIYDKDEIVEIIERPMPSKGNNPASAKDCLTEARRYYASRNARPGNRYRCVKNYKLAIAWGASLTRVDDEQFDGAPASLNGGATPGVKQELADRLTDQYNDALALLREKDYVNAEKSYRQLLAMYPAGEPPNGDRDDKLLKNFQDYMGKTKKEKAKARR